MLVADEQIKSLVSIFFLFFTIYFPTSDGRQWELLDGAGRN